MKRLKTDDGSQIVVVNGRYSYAWDGQPELQLGDAVIVEGRSPGSHFTGVVTDFGTDFKGALKPVEAIVTDMIKDAHDFASDDEG